MLPGSHVNYGAARRQSLPLSRLQPAFAAKPQDLPSGSRAHRRTNRTRRPAPTPAAVARRGRRRRLLPCRRASAWPSSSPRCAAAARECHTPRLPATRPRPAADHRAGRADRPPIDLPPTPPPRPNQSVLPPDMQEKSTHSQSDHGATYLKDDAAWRRHLDLPASNARVWGCGGFFYWPNARRSLTLLDCVFPANDRTSRTPPISSFEAPSVMNYLPQQYQWRRCRSCSWTIRRRRRTSRSSRAWPCVGSPASSPRAADLHLSLLSDKD